MKRKYGNWVILILLGLVLAPITAAAESSDFGAKGAIANDAPTLTDMMAYAIQDEYLARAEYELIMKEHGDIRPFTNIILAEERHIEWMKELFDGNRTAVPPDTAEEHVLLPATLKAAFETGVQAEIDNIAMYESFLERNLPDDVRDVFERLKNASENHLRAFQNNLRKYN